jgi:hypothetical protein
MLPVLLFWLFFPSYCRGGRGRGQLQTRVFLPVPSL